MRRRGLLALSVVVAVLAVAGCGRNDFENDPRPPVPAEVTAKISDKQVVVSPKEFPAGLVNLSVANLGHTPATFAIRGPVDAESQEIAPGANLTLKTELKTGDYEASAKGAEALPFSFTVGADGESGQNDLLLP